MWETDPSVTPLNLKYRMSEDLARFIQEGYLLEVGYNLYDLDVTDIKNHELADDGTTLKLYVTTSEAEGADTEVLFKLRMKPGAISFKLSVISSTKRINHISWGFKPSSEEEGLFGFGERFVPEQNKRKLSSSFYTWAEEGGFGAGTEFRLPKGEMSTYMPIPFFLSSGTGWGYFVDTSYRTEFQLNEGDYRFEVEAPYFTLTFYTGESPAESLGLYTEDTGRSLIPPLF